MDELKAKQQVIDAGKRLVEQGLIARTWGNVSCRVDDGHFVITPSGKPYETLTPEQIVKVAVETLEYGGDVKPSSEKGVHAEVYKARPEIQFVIHTHQKFASVACALGSGIKGIAGDAARIIGSEVPLAAYGLPGTKKLKNGVAEALRNSSSNAFLMAHHGALCFGEDSEKAFEAAQTLETVCENRLYGKLQSEYGAEAADMAAFSRAIAKRAVNKDITPAPAVTSRRDGANMILTEDGAEKVVPVAGGKAASGEAELHRAVYTLREDIRCIIHTRQSEALAASSFGVGLKPQVDDFAQIVGADTRCAVFDGSAASAAKCAKALKGRHAVLLKDDGALCCGKNESDARAVEMITEKNSLAFLGAVLFNADKPIKPLEARLMRFVYLKKYSKQAE